MVINVVVLISWFIWMRASPLYTWLWYWSHSSVFCVCGVLWHKFKWCIDCCWWNLYTVLQNIRTRINGYVGILIKLRTGFTGLCTVNKRWRTDFFMPPQVMIWCILWLRPTVGRTLQGKFIKCYAWKEKSVVLSTTAVCPSELCSTVI
jgi:hypothetical protein